MSGGNIGEPTKTSLEDLTFTGRVYIYHFDDLTPRQVSDLTDIYAAKQESLILRGFEYFVAEQKSRLIPKPK
jgi:hypothetical protein